MLPTLLFLLLAPATEVIRYQPPSSLPSKKQTGSCWTASIAAPYRPDAWRCTVGNEIHDPCFVTAKRGRLLCDMNPASGARGFVLSLSKTLPERKGPAPNGPTVWAWLVELEDGARCQPFTSTRPFPRWGSRALQLQLDCPEPECCPDRGDLEHRPDLDCEAGSPRALRRRPVRGPGAYLCPFEKGLAVKGVRIDRPS